MFIPVSLPSRSCDTYLGLDGPSEHERLSKINVSDTDRCTCTQCTVSMLIVRVVATRFDLLRAKSSESPVFVLYLRNSCLTICEPGGPPYCLLGRTLPFGFRSEHENLSIFQNIIVRSSASGFLTFQHTVKTCPGTDTKYDR